MRRPLVPRREENREAVSSLRGPGRSPGRKRFNCNLIFAHRLCWELQITANSSPFHPEKCGYGTPQSKTWGYRYPLYPLNYVYGTYELDLILDHARDVDFSGFTKCSFITVIAYSFSCYCMLFLSVITTYYDQCQSNTTSTVVKSAAGTCFAC